MSKFWRTLELGLCLLMLLSAGWVPAAVGAQATPPAGPRWLAFDGLAGEGEPSLAVTQADAAAVELRADLPGCWAEDLSAEGQAYSRLFGAGYGYGPEYGRPDLPVLRQPVEVPFGAELRLELLAAEYVDYPLQDLGLAPIYPLQPPVPKQPGAQENTPFVIDRQWYTGGEAYPAAPLALGEAYTVRGHRLQTLEAWPVQYDPLAGTVRLYNRIEFRLRLQGSDMALTEARATRYASPAFEGWLSWNVLNYNQGRGAVEFAPDADPGYLIVVADAYYEAMLPFAELRDSRGFDVTMTRLSDIPGSGSNADIKAYIQDAYDNWPLPPSYVLLVGDTDTIPGWPSQSAGEITDLYYATVEGTDWHPDIGRGRFPVRSAQQVTAMVDKYIEYANFTGDEPWLKKIAFIATCDDWQTAEGTHNYVVNTYTQPNGYTGMFPNNPQPGGDKIYCVTYGGSATHITNAAEDGRWAIIYSGHGSTGGWGDGAVSYSQADVIGLTDYGFYPFVGSHACNTGDFAVSEAYCETWVLQEGKGALVFWGSSDSSYWGPDDTLERAMFDELFANVQADHADVTAMTYHGLAETEANYPSYAQYYWETYNIMGDPAVKIFIEPDLPNFSLDVEPAAHEICGSGLLTSSVHVDSFLGYSETVHLETGELPAGMTATIEPPAAQAPYTAVLSLQVAPGTPMADYTLLVTASDTISWTHDAPVDLRVVTSTPDLPLLLAPPDGATDQPLAPTLEWAELPFASSYALQLDDSPLFPAPLVDETGLTGNGYTLPSPLEGGRCYWWHARGNNACGPGNWADAFHFATVALAVSFYDDLESGSALWNHQAAQGTDHWTLSEDYAHSPTHAWHVPDDSVVTDSRLWNVTPVSVGAGSTLTFWHRYNFESSYDGAVLELSSNGGTTWTDLGPYITSNGYNGTISTCCSNPLGGRQAWVSDLSEWTQVEVDLGSFAGQDVQIRWRIGCDYTIGDSGWYIDDVQITSPLDPEPSPTLLSIAPEQGSAYQETPVQVNGDGFFGQPALQLGSTWLLSVTLASSTTLDAVVPAGLPGGVYTLTLYNGDCQTALLPEAFTVFEQCVSPTVELSSDSPVELGQAIHFVAATGGTPPYTYTWDMGGPGTGQGLETATPVYTYTLPGVYTASVLVENACGSAADSLPVEVWCNEPVVSISSSSPVTLGQAMHFTSTLLSGTAPFSYSWDFGDGAGSSSEPYPVYTYTEAGVYSVSLAVENPCGQDVVGIPVEVIAPCEPPLAILQSDSPVELGQAMHLTATVLSGTAPLSYTWAMGGPGTGQGLDTATPVLTYTDPGTFTVRLTVSNACGQDVERLAVSVLCSPPQASFDSDSPVQLGQPVHLTATAGGTGPLAYTWDMGGPGQGQGLDTATPVLSYTEAGTYTVALTVSNPCGQIVLQDTVVVAAPPLYRFYLPVLVRGENR